MNFLNILKPFESFLVDSEQNLFPLPGKRAQQWEKARTLPFREPPPPKHTPKGPTYDCPAPKYGS